MIIIEWTDRIHSPSLDAKTLVQTVTGEMPVLRSKYSLANSAVPLMVDGFLSQLDGNWWTSQCNDFSAEDYNYELVISISNGYYYKL